MRPQTAHQAKRRNRGRLVGHQRRGTPTLIAFVAATMITSAPTADAIVLQPVILTEVPEFWDGTGELRWTPSFLPAENRRYLVRFREENGADQAELPSNEILGTFPNIYVSLIPTPGFLFDGRRYDTTISAVEILNPDTCNPFFPDTCDIESNESTPRTFPVDRTPPTLAGVAINNGAVYTGSRDVTLQLDAIDPPSSGRPASGVQAVEITETGTFTCSKSNPFALDCPRRTSGLVTARLNGPDGVRTLTVRVRDGARPFLQPCGSSVGCIFGRDPLVGNVSPTTATDSIILDTTPPTVTISQSAATVPAGRSVSLSALATVDGANSQLDSGIDLSSFRWRLGDGAAASGPTVTHTYMRPGTVTGDITVGDRVGNRATHTFTVRVGNPVIGRLRRSGSYRAGRRGVVVTTTTAPTQFTATLRRGRTIVKRFTVLGGPGEVKLRFRPRRAGAHTLTVVGGGTTKRIGLTVTR